MKIEFDGKNNQRLEYSGRYRGILWTVLANASTDARSDRYFDFCHYIHVLLEQIPEDRREDFWLKSKEHVRPASGKIDIFYNYAGSIINSLEWHGGCTFYEKRGGIDGRPRWIKAGCDYMHSWDVGQYFDLDYVITEAKYTIDSLHKLIPNISIHCCDGYCGKIFHLENEGVYTGDERTYFICIFCDEKRKKDQELKEKV